MSSTFFGLYIAQSGLNAFQAAINTTANNISNVETPGYSRQEVQLKATSSLRAYQKYGSVSTGVSPDSIDRQRDKYYDQKYWQNQSSYGFYDTKNYYMLQIEDYFTDTKATQGFTTIFNSMFNSLDAIKSSPSDSSIRAQFVNDSEKLSLFFNHTSTQLQELQTAINDQIKAEVDEINAIAQKIATLNKQINTLEVSKSNANELRDERELLLDRLSEIVTITTEEDVVEDPNFPDLDTGLSLFNVKINGQPLVSTGEYYKLMVETRTEKDNLMDIEGLYDIKWENTGNSLRLTGYSQTGSLRGLVEMRDGNDEGNIHGVVMASFTPDDDAPADIKALKDVKDDDGFPVFATNDRHIYIENTNYTDTASINFPPTGSVTIKGVEYLYDSFDVALDTDGSILGISFHTRNTVTTDMRANINGAELSVGNTIDCKGIPYYQNQMNLFLRNFSKAFNDIQYDGEDLHRDKGQTFFVAKDDMTGDERLFADIYETVNVPGSGYKNTFSSTDDTYYRMNAGNIFVNTAIHDDLRKFSSATYKPDEQGVDDSTLIDRMMKLEKDVEIYRGGGASSFLETIYSDVTVDTRESTMFLDYYTNIQKSIEKQRKSISGVDEDEEAQNLVKFQNAYNLSSKVISVLKEMYDQLILNTM